MDHWGGIHFIIYYFSLHPFLSLLSDVCLSNMLGVSLGVCSRLPVCSPVGQGSRRALDPSGIQPTCRHGNKSHTFLWDYLYVGSLDHSMSQKTQRASIFLGIIRSAPIQLPHSTCAMHRTGPQKTWHFTVSSQEWPPTDYVLFWLFTTAVIFNLLIGEGDRLFNESALIFNMYLMKCRLLISSHE